MFLVKVHEYDYVVIFRRNVICSYHKQTIDDHSTSNSLQWSHIINFQFGRFSFFSPLIGQDSVTCGLKAGMLESECTAIARQLLL
jgi:hypothetical protein